MKAGKPTAGSVAKRIDKAAKVQMLIRREHERHNRRVASLGKQRGAALRIEDEGRRSMAAERIGGQLDDEAAKHRQRLADLSIRLRDVWLK